MRKPHSRTARRSYLLKTLGCLVVTSITARCLADGLETPTLAGPISAAELDELSVDSSGIAVELTAGDELTFKAPSVDGEAESIREVSSSNSLGEVLLQKFPNGKLQIERFVVEDQQGNFVNHGSYKEYDSKGDLVRSGNFKMGTMDGSWTQTLSLDAVQALAPKVDAGFKPPFRSTAQFVDGKLHGDWMIADSKGNAVLVWQFAEGKRENVSNWFDSKHATIQTIAYQENVPHGPSTVSVPGQREPKTQSYVHGKLVQPRVEWYDRGRKRLEESVLTAAAGKIEENDWWNSRVRIEKAVEDTPVRHGQFTTWHPSGAISCTGQYDLGRPTGEFTWWYGNSQVLAKGTYDAQGKTGRWTWWHENGMKMLDGQYEGGAMTGVWSQWKEDGGLVARDSSDRFPTEQLESMELFQRDQKPEANLKPSSVGQKPLQQPIPVRSASLQRRPSSLQR